MIIYRVLCVILGMFCFKHNAQEGPAIKFRNVSSDDHFNYSIVLISGEIANYNYRLGSTTLRITNRNNENWSNESVEITADGKFRIAVELTPGANLLRFHYCCVTNEIPLVFRERENPEYLLKVLYIVCQNHDGCFQAPNGTENTIEVACEKIDTVIRLVQCLYAEMLAKHGFNRKTFEFIECQPFHSSLTLSEARQWNQHELWKYHAKEILAKESDTHHQYKYFGILAGTICENGTIKGNAALGIGDVALFGSGTLYAWPLNFASIETCFRDDTSVDTTQLMDDSNGRRTFGGCFATALGSICHEIGHIFDLGHTIDGIMGSDIDYVNRMFVIDKRPYDLPRRIASKCSLAQENQDTTKVIGKRLTTVKKTNPILAKYHSRRTDDLTFLTVNCAILLNCHKWFNQPEKIESDIRYDSDRKAIISSLPLALVEIRSADTGMCMKFNRFDTSNEHSFIVSSDIINQMNYDLIALDKNGNIKRFARNEFC